MFLFGMLSCFLMTQKIEKTLRAAGLAAEDGGYPGAETSSCLDACGERSVVDHTVDGSEILQTS